MVSRRAFVLVPEMLQTSVGVLSNFQVDIEVYWLLERFMYDRSNKLANGQSRDFLSDNSLEETRANTSSNRHIGRCYSHRRGSLIL